MVTRTVAGPTGWYLNAEGDTSGTDSEETAREVSPLRGSISPGPCGPDFGDVGTIADL